jgi:hypothetical protein
VVVVMVLYLTLMLGSVGVRKGGSVGVRKGGREGGGHVTPSNTHVLKVGPEKVYDRRAWLSFYFQGL